MHRLSFLAVLLTAPAFARPGQPHSFAQTAAPFIDEHTLIVVRVDVNRVELDPVFKFATAILGNDDEVGDGIKNVRAWVRQFSSRGGNELFFTYGAGDYPNLPCIIAPARGDEALQKDLAELLVLAFKQTGKDADWTYLHGCVCVGTKDALAVAKSRKSVPRPELTAAIEAGNTGVAQLAFALSAEAKKIHEQIAPTLPRELGGGSIHKITRGMKWMALTIGPGPKMPAKLITEAASPEA